MRTLEILCLTAVFLIACGCPSADAATPTPTAATSQSALCEQSTIDALSTLHSRLKVPDYLVKGEPRRPAEEFDANETLSILSRLAMEPGYVLDYVYHAEGIGGLPVLYARLMDQAPYLTYDEFIAASSSPPDVYTEHVRTDGTPEGFFELALLHLMGDQFYLHWHAYYNDETALCDRTALEALVSDLEKNDFGLPLSAKQAEQALALDVTPSVEFKGVTVTVRFVVFTMWGGFLQQAYTFERESPHRLVSDEATELVPYNCGVAF